MSWLDLAIEYRERKKNSADRFFYQSNYMNKDDTLIHIVNYVTCLSSKRIMAQNISKESSQISEELEVNIKPDDLENLLNKPVSHKSIVGNNLLSVLESELPIIHSSEAAKRAFKKRKHNAEELDALKHQSKKIRIKAKLPEMMSKPSRLYPLKDDNLALQVDRQEIKAISKKKKIGFWCSIL